MHNKDLIFTLDMTNRNEQFYSSLFDFIAYLENTTDDQWCVDVVKNRNGGNCLFGHLWDWAGGDVNEERANQLWAWFENCVSTTHYVYPINDKKNPNYQQDTPKERCVAYLRNVIAGYELTTFESIDSCMLQGNKDDGNWYMAYKYMGVSDELATLLANRKQSAHKYS